MHVGAPGRQKSDVQYTSERVLLAAEAAGLSQVWIIANGSYDGTNEDDVRAENDYVIDAEAQAKDRARIVAAVSVPLMSPRRPDR